MNKADLDKTISFLSQVPFFSEVENTSLTLLCENLVQKSFLRKENIIDKGEVGEAMYVILKGKVVVHENNHAYGNLLPGDCFGEYALIDSQTRSASVTAEEPTVVLKIERKNFIDLMSKDSGFAQGILTVMIKRHRELDDIQKSLTISKEALELANSKMSGLIDGAMDTIIMFDHKFRIVLTNPAANKLLENDDVLQRNVLFFFEEEDAALLEATIKAAKDRKSGLINHYLSRPIQVIGSKGSKSTNEGTLSQYGNEQEIYYTLILRDIQQRILAEDKIDRLTTQTHYLQEEIKELTSDYGIIGEDVSMKKLLNQVRQVASTDTTVLITGETGTGKELVARAIHQASARAEKPMIRINCGAIPENLIESELFGHEKGAFTGASAPRKGRFLLADKGTIFLDEIGELPLMLQPKLLRVIQEGEFDPVGSAKTQKVDVRIIAATHRKLLSQSQAGKFREDLYYRLNVFPIQVPALRDRDQDIILIAEEMVKQLSLKLNKKIDPLSEADKSWMCKYQWPGNVRELQNLIERAVIIATGKQLNLGNIIPIESGQPALPTQSAKEIILTAEEMVDLEKANILKALRKTRWKISGENGAANLLKVPPTTLTSRIKALGIKRPI